MNPPKWLIYTLIVVALILAAVATVAIVINEPKDTLGNVESQVEYMRIANATSTINVSATTEPEDAIGTEGYAEHLRIANALSTMPGTTNWDIITTKQITNKLVPLKKVIEMKYFHDISITNNTSIEASKQRGSVLKILTEYALATVDTVALANDAESTNQITFRLKGRDYTALLTKFQEKTYDDGSWLKWYTGTIIDDHNNPVAGKVKLAVGDTTVEGGITLWSDSPSQEIYEFEEIWRQEDGQIVHLVRNRDKKLEEWKHGSGKSFDVVIYETPEKPTPIPTPPHSPQRSTNKTTTQSNITPVGGTGTETINIFAVYDTEFNNKFSSPTQAIDKMFTDVKTAFSPADVTFNIKGYQLDTALTLNSRASSKTNDLLCDLRTNYKSTRDSKKADMAFLFTGKQLGNDIGGAFQYSGSATNGYGLAMMINDGGTGSGVRFDGQPTQRAVLIAHELGHNLNANHENAYSWTESGSKKYTIMQAEWKGDEEQLEFSNKDNHGDSTHNNIQRIKDAKSTVAGFQ